MSLDSFEQSLLIELRQQVSVRTGSAPLTASPTARRRGHLAVGITASLAAAATVLALALGTGPGRPSAAYAVETAANGSVVVTIHDLSDVDGLERALAAKGVHAQVAHLPGFAQSTGQSPATGGSTDPTTCSIRLAKVDGGLRFTLGRAQVTGGAVLDIIVSGSSASDVHSPVAVTWSGGC